MLRKLQPPTGVAARFADDSFRVGSIQLGRKQVVCVMNWSDGPQSISFSLTRRSQIKDFWNDTSLGTHKGSFELKDFPSRTGRILICE
jgi:hypothetical protein